MKKRIYSVLLCLAMMLAFMNLSAFAAEISDVTVDYPNIAALVNGISSNEIDSSKIKATLDGKELKVSSAESKAGSTEWIILIDTSKSTIKYFEAEKEAVLSVYKSLGEGDKLSLYTFDTGIVTVLDGSESKEDAEKKIKALECNGQDTVFYEATEKLIAKASESTKDNVISVIFSDGIDTISKNTTKEKTAEKLSNSKYPIYGFYADSLKADTAKQFNDLLAKSKGGAKAFSAGNASSLLAEKSSKQVVISAAASTDFDAKENAELKIDLGNGSIISKSVKIPEYKAAEQSTDDVSAESTTKKADDKKDESSFPIIPVIAVVVIAVIAAVVFLLLKKKGSKKPEENSVTVPEAKPVEEKTAESGEAKSEDKPEDDKKEDKKEEKKVKKDKKKSKDEAQFQFYFVDKK